MSTVTSHKTRSKPKPVLSDNAQGILLMIGTFAIIALMFTSLYQQGY